MEPKPITKKQMRWLIGGQVLTLVLTGLSIWISESIVQKALGGLLFALTIYVIIETFLRWKKHPLVDEEADEEFMEDQKSSLSAILGSLLILFAAIFFIVMSIRAF
jgi:F0F1-type ATP synthase assembly protein I